MPCQRWLKPWIYYLFIIVMGTKSARPRFDTSTDMGMVLVPSDAEVDSVIFRLRATDQDADFPLIFDITATVTPIVQIENLPCTLYNKVCQANVILIRRLTAGRLHDFAVRVRDSKGDFNTMQATISVTNATTSRDLIFPHIPALILVPEDTKPGKELDYILVKSNPWSGKPVYIELWQPKELFTIQQRQTPTHTRGMITLIGELDFETQSMYTLTIYATDPYTDPKKDTRNIAGLRLVVIVKDVQDVPPVFTLAPPLTKINNTVQTGDVILRVHAEDGDKGVPREVTYGLVSEGNPFTPFFNISESTGEIILVRPLEQLTQITHIGAPVVLSVVAEEIRRSSDEPLAQATVVKVGLLLGEPGNSPPYFENDNYVAWINENTELGSSVIFNEPYVTKVHDEDIGKAGVFALKLDNNNGTFEIGPTVAERMANFTLTVRDNTLIDYEIYRSLQLKIIAQEIGPSTNLSTSVSVTIFIRDINDNAPEFDEKSYQVTLPENITAGTRVIQVHATDKDTGLFGKIKYTKITGPGNEAFTIDPYTGIITVAMGTAILDREIISQLQLSIEARDENGLGLNGIVPFIVNLLDVNDNAPIFEKDTYEFTLNDNLMNFTIPAVIKAFDSDSEPPNNQVRYELIHGNYDNKFILNNTTGELFIREQITKIRNIRHDFNRRFTTKFKKILGEIQEEATEKTFAPTKSLVTSTVSNSYTNDNRDILNRQNDMTSRRQKREEKNILFTLTARAYDLGVPHLSSTTQVNILQNLATAARKVMFVVPGENPDPVKTARTLATITGGRIIVEEIRPYTPQTNLPNNSGNNVSSSESGKRSIVVARVEQSESGTSFVDIEKIRAALAANGVGVITDDMKNGEMVPGVDARDNGGTINNNNTITSVHSEEVTIYRTENKLLTWLLIILGLLMLAAIITLIICCICPTCPFYMAPRKRRIHSSETLLAPSDSRTRRHIHHKHLLMTNDTYTRKKQAWSADPTRNWKFNRRNIKNYGMASLPGDVARIEIDREHEIPYETHSLQLKNVAPIPMFVTDSMGNWRDNDRLYIEDPEISRVHGFPMTNVNKIQQEKFNNIQKCRENQNIREQHYYREGNAEVMRLVTRGIEETTVPMHHSHHQQHRNQPEIIIDQASVHRFDGKDILLHRFIEDQKLRINTQENHDSMQDLERLSMQSHQRKQGTTMEQQQQEIILIPEKLERRHIEELGPDVQRLIIEHGGYEKSIRSDIKDTSYDLNSKTLLIHGPMTRINEKSLIDNEKQFNNDDNIQHYSIHDLELARQNVLLTRLLLERDRNGGGGGSGIVLDTGSYLETQSLPGQVAAGTQTNQTISTQTELRQKQQQQNRSRSDNDESEEEAKIRRRLKSKKRCDGEPKRIRTMWMKSPFSEEERQYEKRKNLLRKKTQDIKDGRKISSIEPQVLKEISDSLDETGDTPPTIHQVFVNSSNSHYDSTKEEDLPQREESSSVEMVKSDYTKSHKNRERIEHDINVNRPSFRVLEREIDSLSKKLTKLVGKKVSESEEESSDIGKLLKKDSKEKNENVCIDSEKKNKKIEIVKAKKSKLNKKIVQSSLSKKQLKIEQSDSISSDRIKKPKINYRKKLPISTGSSELEDTIEKPKKKFSISKVIEGEKLKMNFIKNVKSSRPQFQRQTAVDLKNGKKMTGTLVQGSENQNEAIVAPMKASLQVKKKLIMSKDDSALIEKNKIQSTGKETSIRENDSEKNSSCSSTIFDNNSVNQLKSNNYMEKKSKLIDGTSLEVEENSSTDETKSSLPVKKMIESIADEISFAESMEFYKHDASSPTRLQVTKMTSEIGEISKNNSNNVELNIEKIAPTSSESIDEAENLSNVKPIEVIEQPTIESCVLIKEMKDETMKIEKLIPSPETIVKKIVDEDRSVELNSSDLGKKIVDDTKDIAKDKTEEQFINQHMLKDDIKIEEIISTNQDSISYESPMNEENEILKLIGIKEPEKIEITTIDSINQVPIKITEVIPKSSPITSTKTTLIITQPTIPSFHEFQTLTDETKIEEFESGTSNLKKNLIDIGPNNEEELNKKEEKISSILGKEDLSDIAINTLEIPEKLIDLSKDKETMQLVLEKLSIISQDDSRSSTPTRIIISRETSFLNSPRKQSVDETIKTPEIALENLEKLEESEIKKLKLEIDDVENKSLCSPNNREIIIDELKPLETVASETRIKIVPSTYDLTETNIDILEDDSDVSSESSIQTAFIAQPYGTPRHRRLIRIEHMENTSIDDFTLPQLEKELTPIVVDRISNEIVREIPPEHEIVLDNDKIDEILEINTNETIDSSQIIDNLNKIGDLTAKSTVGDNYIEEESKNLLERVDDFSKNAKICETIESINEIESETVNESKNTHEFFSTDATEKSDLKLDNVIFNVEDTREMKNKEETSPKKVEPINKSENDQLVSIIDDSSIADQSEVKKSDQDIQQVSTSLGKMLDTMDKLLLIKSDDNEESKKQEVEHDNCEIDKERSLNPWGISKIISKKKVKSTKVSGKKDQSSAVVETSSDRNSHLRQTMKRQLNICESPNKRSKARKKLEYDKIFLEKNLKRKKTEKEKDVFRRKLIKEEKIYNEPKSITDHSRLSKKNREKTSGRNPKIGDVKKALSSSEVEKKIDELQSPLKKIIVEKMMIHLDSTEHVGDIEKTTKTSSDKYDEMSKTPIGLKIEDKNKKISDASSQLSGIDTVDIIISKTDEKCESDDISKTESQKMIEDNSTICLEISDEKLKSEPIKLPSPQKIGIKHNRDDHVEAQSRYMAWYKHNREETERRKRERKLGDDENEEPPKWLRKSTRQRWLKMSPEDRKMFSVHTPELTPRSTRRKIQPLINIESEQLKEIVRQGRKLQRAHGGPHDPIVEFFMPEKPSTSTPFTAELSTITTTVTTATATTTTTTSTITKYHYLIQHSEYKYEKIPPPFYLHPPSPNSHLPPQYSNMDEPQISCASGTFQPPNNADGDIDTGIVVSMSGTNRLRHQQLLEKKSVFDIAYNEAAPSHLRADSTTPPS